MLTTILAVIFLHEQLTLARVGAAAIGFFGVVVACNPAGVTLGLPAMLVLLAAFCWAVAMILMRTISKTESALVQVLALNLFYVIVLGPVALPFWQPMALEDLGIVLAVGVIGGIAQYVLVEAARAIPASVLGTVEYSALLWAFLLGYLFWREEPAATVYYGAVLIMAAGFILAWSEHRARRTIFDTP